MATESLQNKEIYTLIFNVSSPPKTTILLTNHSFLGPPFPHLQAITLHHIPRLGATHPLLGVSGILPAG